MKQKKPLAENGMLIAILSSVLSIIVGLVFGAILLLILNPAKAGIGISAMLTTPWWGPSSSSCPGSSAC